MKYLHRLKSRDAALMRVSSVIAAALLVQIAGNAATPIVHDTPPVAAKPEEAISVSLIAAPHAAVAPLDFGLRVQNRSEPISEAFELTNNAGKTINVTALRPSCGCTAALIEGSSSALPYALKAGAKMLIRVNIDTFHLTPGKIDKTVSVIAEGQNDPIAVLELTGSVLSAVTFSKPAIDFGRIDAGGESRVYVSLTYAISTEATAANIDMVSSDPNIIINSGGKDEGPAAATAGEDTEPKNHRTFNVTLRPGSNIGTLSGRLSAVLQGTTGATLTLAELPFTGIVTGEITATPQVVAFGTSLHGHTATQQILITGKDVKSITTTSPSPYITAAFNSKLIDAARVNRPFGAAPTDKNGSVPDSAKAVLLTVTLSPKAPAGIIESSITLTTTHGQTLRLPVYGVVTAH